MNLTLNFLLYCQLFISPEMERHLQKSSNLGNPTDCDDAKYVSGLSTILVATIQEAKDRISQIEYIFCSQLFPNFQSKSKSLQKIYSDAKKAAEDAFKERENNLKLQIESLQLEKLAALEENQALKLEMEKPSKDREGKTNQLLAEVKSQQLKIDELEWKLKKSSVEIDEGMELQNRLLQLVQSKASAIVHVGKQLKEYEEKTNELLSEVARLQEKVDELQEELRRKTEKVAEGKELQENLFKKIASLGSEILANEQKLTDNGKEKKSLMSKLECLEDNASKLQEELEKKTCEVEEGRKLQNQLLQQIDLNNTEMSKNKQQLQECEKEKKLLLAKVTVLEGKINELQVSLRGKSSEVAEGRDSYKKLLQQIDKKTSELLAEKKRRMENINSYKKLKSQYNFLCLRFGLTPENMLPQSDSLRHNQVSVTSRDPANKVLDTFVAPCDTNKVMYDNCFSGSSEDEKGAKLVEPMSSGSPASCFPVAPYLSNVRSAPVAGSKRPASRWRDTRSGQCQGGPEPYDDFLATPLENIRGNLNKAMKEQVRDSPVPIQKDGNFDYSDDETQDMNVECCPQKQQMAVPMAGRKGFKYVETVRKKADRENLKGIECKQCKKFYDAVLPDDGGSDTSGNQGNFRCEHHEGVSRHRYKYAPPMTPEGFWNIGFESEMS
ncbi:protein gamma response 1 isoform X2 [Carya illinoinensis]|nr:protein gamma response 1 isoform X2 [Carya illinoinensis]